MARRNSAPRPRRIETLSTDVLELPLSEAIGVAECWWEATHLLDDLDTTRRNDDLRQITSTCETLGLRTYRDALDNTAHIVAAAAGLDRLNTFVTTEQSHNLFSLRNHLGAALAAVALDTGHNPALATGRLPEPNPRAGGYSRACFDDEILLLRHRAVHALTRGGRLLLGGCQYALTEAGAMPVETTTVHANDLNHLRKPTAVRLAGAHYHQARTVDLPRWTHGPLALALDEHLAQDRQAATRPIAYGGNKSGNVASAAASLMLRRSLIGAGLTEDCVQPKGVLKWRAKHTLNTRGFPAAIALLGKTKAIQVQHFIDGDDDGSGEVPESDIDSFFD